ncbi:MAG: glycosyltransferase [Limisphaerales bacterium]
MPPLQQSQALVSVVIPLFNHARYVACCLTSLMDSGYRPLEILILDDGSTDNSFEVVQAWSARHSDPDVVVRLTRQPNQGLTRTLNRLVTRANGEFIVLLASDDYLLPGGVGWRVEALQNHPQWLAVFGDGMVVDEAGRKVHESWLTDRLGANKRALANPRAIAMELILRWGLPGGALMVRRSAYDPAVGVGLYDETLPFEDRDFNLKALARGGLGFIDRTVSAYRQHPQNFFKVKDRERLAGYYRGLYRCEHANVRLFKGPARLALWLSSQVALDLSQRAVGNRGLHPAVRKAIKLTLKVLYQCHRCRVFLSPADTPNNP